MTDVTSSPNFAERGLGQEAQVLGTFRVARVDDEENEEERKKSYTATRTECYPPPHQTLLLKYSRGVSEVLERTSTNPEINKDTQRRSARKQRTIYAAV